RNSVSTKLVADISGENVNQNFQTKKDDLPERVGRFVLHGICAKDQSGVSPASGFCCGHQR
ncbi:MAG TPA: hypothetical protein PLV72_00360, partial [Candidatus Magasanikbacteria bacterium]|nr:hypothetical protein [Candidatus Magasanikbacteria bacterium]